MLPDGAFTALLLLISGLSAVIVPPPTNVTVSCQNVRVTVSWDSSDQQAATSFRVNISSSAGSLVSETTEHQFDLSPFIWASQARYMGFHHVTVTAVQGGHQSVPVNSKSFSFNELKTSHMQCELVFPPVDLNENESGVTVTFRNPFLHYTELKAASKSNDAFFAFTVTSDDGDFDKACDKGCEDDCNKDCTLKEEYCKRDIPITKGGRTECVTLKGWLFDGRCVNHVSFKQTERICISRQDNLSLIMLVTLLSITVLIIGVATIFICKAKAWTMAVPENLPPSLRSNPGRRDVKYNNVSDAVISAVGLSVSDPREMDSVSSEEESEPILLVDGELGSGFQPPACTYTDGRNLESSDQEPEARGLMSEENRTDDESADDSVRTECVSLDLEEGTEERWVYDCPHA